MNDRKFTGYWIPWEMVDLFETDQISMSEMFLLSAIHALCKRAEGCTASNAYLAECVKLNPTGSQIKAQISHLKEMALVFTEMKDGVRTIWTYLEVLEGWTRGSGKTDSGGPEKRTEESGKTDTPSLLKQGRGYTSNKQEVGDGKVTFSARVAGELIEFLLKRRKVVARPNIRKKWAQQVRLLRTQDGFTKDEIDEVFTWFRKHEGEQYIPTIYNDRDLREKFPKLKAQMEKRGGETRNAKAADLRATDLNSTETEIYDEVLTYGWPKGSATQLPAVVRASVKNFNAVLKQWQDMRPKDPKMKELKREVEYNVWCADVRTTVREYLVRVHGRIKNWQDWSGDLRQYVWTLACKDTAARGRETAERAVGDAGLWDSFVEQLTK